MINTRHIQSMMFSTQNNTPFDASGNNKLCEFPTCTLKGEYKAPYSPQALRKWRWFCLNHVREYNKAWNYFSGWSEAEIEAWQREDLTGHRPTWPLGKGTNNINITDNLKSHFKNFADDWFNHQDSTKKEKTSKEYLALSQNTEYSKAIGLFQLDTPLTANEIKKKYKFLVKKHHPDTNGGSKESEELLKAINQAYKYLLKLVV